MVTSTEIDLIARVTTALSFPVVIVQLAIALHKHRRERQHYKKDHTLSYITRWNDYEFTMRRRKIAKKFRDLLSQDPQKQVEAIKADDALVGDINHLLNYWEELAMAVNQGAADFDVAYAFFQGIITHYYEMLAPFILARRSDLNEPSLYRDAENLYTLMQCRNRQNYTVPPGRFWLSYPGSHESRRTPRDLAGSGSAPSS